MLKSKIRRWVRDRFSLESGRPSFSQEGEDLVLSEYFQGKLRGFYIDVGAHHPFRFSNTFKLYQQGWRGVNIDPLRGSKQLFDRARPKDINLELGISDIPGTLTYYEFNDPALNGFHEALSLERQKSTSYKILKTSQVPVRRLGEVLNDLGSTIPNEIEVLSVDAEGFDLAVLSSNDWQRFKPKVVIAELRKSSLDKIVEDPIFHFLKERGYRWFACTGRSCFFELK